MTAGLTGSEVLLDLYSGTGTIALCLAGRCKAVWGAESSQGSVEDAMANARRNGITNARFLQADLSSAADMAHVAERVPRPDVVVAGAGSSLISPSEAIWSLIKWMHRKPSTHDTGVWAAANS